MKNKYVLQVPHEKVTPNPIQFSITPESLQNVRDRARIPRFLVTGMLDSTVCCITKPFTGEVCKNTQDIICYWILICV